MRLPLILALTSLAALGCQAPHIHTQAATPPPAPRAPELPGELAIPKAAPAPSSPTPGPLPDQRPVDHDADAEPLWITARILPLAQFIRGSIKDGPRGQTERLQLIEDLDLNPIHAGLIIDTRLHYRRIATFALEVFESRSVGDARSTVSTELQRFDGVTFRRGERLESSFSLQWLRAEAGLVFSGEWFYVDVLAGARYVGYRLHIDGSRGEQTTAHESLWFFYVPGVIAALRLWRDLWGQLETRNAFLAAPLGPQFTDGRLSFFWSDERFRVGIGGQLTTISVFRIKHQVRGRQINNYKSLELFGLGLFIDLQVSF